MTIPQVGDLKEEELKHFGACFRRDRRDYQGVAFEALTQLCSQLSFSLGLPDPESPIPFRNLDGLCSPPLKWHRASFQFPRKGTPTNTYIFREIHSLAAFPSPTAGPEEGGLWCAGRCLCQGLRLGAVAALRRLPWRCFFRGGTGHFFAGVSQKSQVVLFFFFFLGGGEGGLGFLMV